MIDESATQRSKSDLPARRADLSPVKRALLEQRLRGAQPGAGRRGEIPRRGTTGPAPLSFAQQRLWVLDQLEPGNPAYNYEPAAIRLSGALHAAALQQAFDAVVRRHAILRTTFSMVDEQPVQVIAPELRVPMATVDLRALPAAQQEASLQCLAREEARRPFDLQRGPLLRVTLVCLAEQEHVLLVATHHIVFDGWSVGVLIGEMAQLYPAFCLGKAVTLAELPVQYADFATWQRGWLQGEVLEGLLAYWNEQLGGELPALDLPTDRPRPALQTFHGARRLCEVPAALVEKLRALGRQEQATLFMVLLAGFQILLYRYTGHDDLVLGTPVAGRRQPELDGLLGCFINTLVLRTRLDRDLTVRDLLQRVRSVTLGAYAHQDLPFEQLVAALQPIRDLSHNPLVGVIFGLDSTQRQAPTLGDLTLQPMTVDPGSAKLDLTVALTESADRLQGFWEYNTDLFDATTIARMEAQWRTVLEAMVAAPGQRLADITLLSMAEREQLILTWNATTAAYPRQACVQQLVEAQAQRMPAAVAVEGPGGRLTYAELDRRANQLAHYLRARGVGPEVRVGICLDRTVELVVALLGILKAGGAYVPLDPSYPATRLSFMAQDAGLGMLLTQESLISALPAPEGVPRLCLDVDAATIARESEACPGQNATATNLAYMLYTSGSTGVPKGVLIEHRAVVNLLCAMAREPGLAREDVLGAVTTLSFDIAALELFLPLTVGAQVALVSREEAADGAALLQRLRSVGATVLQATPATWRLLLAGGWEGSPRLRMFCGGEALSRELTEQLLARGDELWNLYGPTETTIWSAVQRVTAGGSRAPAIGRPIANTSFYVLDVAGQLAPVGVVGELYVGGDGVARGYHNRQELTAERFVHDPYAPGPGARMYRTGDRVRWRADGTLEYLGRLDAQVKVRGYRLELGEIESALRQHPAVAEVVVVAHDEGAERRLVAYVAPAPGETLTGSDIRAFVQDTLPPYMTPVPVVLEALPRTPNGKIDRRALPLPGHVQQRTGVETPRTSLETVLASLWAEVLGVQQVGRHESFFALGGDSLAATRLIARTRAIFRVDLPLRRLFEAPSVAGLAQVIAACEASPGQAETIAAALLRVRTMPAEDRQRLLQQRRSTGDVS